MAVEWDRYVGLPFKHLGLDLEKGIDCFNLIKCIYKNELGIEIPYTTRDWCKIVDDYWYQNIHEDYIKKASSKDYGWKRVKEPKEFDVITMVLGSSTITNHCALYIGHNKILHTFQNHKSHTAVYGNYFKQYTMGVYRWTDLQN